MDASIFTEPDDPQSAPQAGASPPRTLTRLKDALALKTVRAQRRFLAEYALCGIVRQAAIKAKVGRATVYQWEEDEAFAQLMRLAFEDAKDAILMAMTSRGIAGVDQPVYHQGKRVDTYKRYSDTMLLALAKARMPHLFGAPGGGAQTTNHTVIGQVNQMSVPLENLTDEEFAVLRRISGKAGPTIIDVPKPGQISENVKENGTLPPCENDAVSGKAEVR